MFLLLLLGWNVTDFRPGQTGDRLASTAVIVAENRPFVRNEFVTGQMLGNNFAIFADKAATGGRARRGAKLPPPAFGATTGRGFMRSGTAGLTSSRRRKIAGLARRQACRRLLRCRQFTRRESLPRSEAAP